MQVAKENPALSSGQLFRLPQGVQQDQNGLYREKVIVQRDKVNPADAVVDVMSNWMFNDFSPGYMRIQLDYFKENTDAQQIGHGLHDLCQAAQEFAQSLGVDLASVRTALRQKIEKRVETYQANQVREKSHVPVDDLNYITRVSATALTRLSVLEDFLDGKIVRSDPSQRQEYSVEGGSTLLQTPYEHEVQQRIAGLISQTQDRVEALSAMNTIISNPPKIPQSS